jgi:hypothetical protein
MRQFKPPIAAGRIYDDPIVPEKLRQFGIRNQSPRNAIDAIDNQ